MNNYEKDAEQAISDLLAHEEATRRAIQSAFRLQRDPLRFFAECLAHTSVIHARSIHTLHRAHAEEIRTIVRRLQDLIAESRHERRVIVFDLWVRQPEHAIKFLLCSVAAALFVGLLVGHFA